MMSPLARLPVTPALMPVAMYSDPLLSAQPSAALASRLGVVLKMF